MFYSKKIINNIVFTVIASNKGIKQLLLNNNCLIEDSISLKYNDKKFFNIFEQLEEYFENIRIKFEIPLDIDGSPFQLKVWNYLMQIPYGTNISYSTISTKIGVTKAQRAIGNANKKNPIPIIIPCHRVILANGKLGGYAYGAKLKKDLIELESRVLI